ncbi:SDR family oxidoreductase [Thalassotalea eurytherma]|uniref:3-oxoacyl-ACP reductase n=1 Tax=Thalassotalea eurytherma TaxID=1144278 RepID=A0ABQ6GZ27_9GAMM|nr:SDR family oxidoreductase [Thalassotalea eurytherma]GLX81206.1 3-oxoacyl-ACP reductase [Thalassotalea eurytherma]
MNLDMTQQNALVCGASQGIGKACATALAKQGANVTLFARNKATLEEVKSSLDTSLGQQHHVLIADFSDPAQVESALSNHLEKIQHIDIVINNTGGPAPGLASQSESAQFINAFEQHLVNNQNIAQLVLPKMKAQGFGRIINVISTSVKQPINGLGVSNTIRGAVASWAKTLANELGQFNITVNNVLPGATATARLNAIISGKASKQNISIEQATINEKATIPMNRFAQPEEFADAVTFLASKSASYITGINLPVDGGRTSCL